MAWIRQLDSGLWAATVYTPLGERITQSHKYKKVITEWANKMESDKAAGDFLDPRLGKITVGEIWDLYNEGRRLQKASQKRDRSHWNKWVEPTWRKRPVGPIRKPHVMLWVADMHEKEAGGWTQTAALNVLRAMLEIAVELGLIRSNPCAGVKVDRPEPHEDRVFEEWEDDLLLGNLEARFPGEPTAALFVEALLYTGCRYEEMAALRKDKVRPRQQGFWVHRVLEKDGTEREVAKSEAGHRFVTVDDDLWPRFDAHMMTVPPGGLLFTAVEGGPLLYDNWLKRIWNRGLLKVVPWTEERIEEWKAERLAAGERPWKVNYYDEVALLEDPQPTPHDCRHTYGTRCAEEGMPEHEIAATMGHSPKGNAVKRYLHARNRRLERARAAMAAVRGRRSPGHPRHTGTRCPNCGHTVPSVQSGRLLAVS